MIDITLLSQLRSFEMVDHRNLKLSTSSMASSLIIKGSAEILFLRPTTNSWCLDTVSCIIFSLHQVTRWPPSGGTTLIVVDTVEWCINFTIRMDSSDEMQLLGKSQKGTQERTQPWGGPVLSSSILGRRLLTLILWVGVRGSQGSRNRLTGKDQKPRAYHRVSIDRWCSRWSCNLQREGVRVGARGSRWWTSEQHRPPSD